MSLTQSQGLEQTTFLKVEIYCKLLPNSHTSWKAVFSRCVLRTPHHACWGSLLPPAPPHGHAGGARAGPPTGARPRHDTPLSEVPELHVGFKTWRVRSEDGRNGTTAPARGGAADTAQLWVPSTFPAGGDVPQEEKRNANSLGASPHVRRTGEPARAFAGRGEARAVVVFKPHVQPCTTSPFLNADPSRLTQRPAGPGRPSQLPPSPAPASGSPAAWFSPT